MPRSRSKRRYGLAPRNARRFAAHLAWALLAMQAAVLVTLAVTSDWGATSGALGERLWAWMNRPAFYPLVALLVGGPILSVLAWRVKGAHRWVIVLSWVAFIAIALWAFPGKVESMLRVILWVAEHESGRR